MAVTPLHKPVNSAYCVKLQLAVSVEKPDSRGIDAATTTDVKPRDNSEAAAD